MAQSTEKTMDRGVVVGDGRFYALDAVRGGALCLGVVLHATLAYLTPPVWILRDAAADAVVNPLFFTIHMFRMCLFFLLAGFFARLVFQRRGAKGFFIDRFKRIAVPLLVFWGPMLAAIITFLVLGALRDNPALATQPAAPPPPLTAQTFPLTHLWFLYVLLIFYAAFVPLRGLIAFIDRGGGLRRVVDAVFGFCVKGGLMGAVFGLPVFLVLWATPDWPFWFGIPTPDTGLVPNAAALSAFAPAFVAGWLLHRNANLLDFIKKQWVSCIVSAIGFTVACLWLGGTSVSVEAVAGASRKIYLSCYILGMWSWSIGLTGLALRFADRPTPVLRYLSDAAYWVYIIHLPLVLGLQYLLLDLNWPMEAKLWAVTAGTLALSLLSYQLLVRYSFIGAILSGRKQARRTRANPKEGSYRNA